MDQVGSSLTPALTQKRDAAPLNLLPPALGAKVHIFLAGNNGTRHLVGEEPFGTGTPSIILQAPNASIHPLVETAHFPIGLPADHHDGKGSACHLNRLAADTPAWRA